MGSVLYSQLYSVKTAETDLARLGITPWDNFVYLIPMQLFFHNVLHSFTTHSFTVSYVGKLKKKISVFSFIFKSRKSFNRYV